MCLRIFWTIFSLRVIKNSIVYFRLSVPYGESDNLRRKWQHRLFSSQKFSHLHLNLSSNQIVQCWSRDSRHPTDDICLTSNPLGPDFDNISPISKLHCGQLMESCRKPAQNSSIADSVAFSCISPIYLTKTEIISRTISLIAQEFILNASTSDPFASISIPPKLFIVGMPRLSFGRFYTSHRRLFKMRPPPIPFLSTPDLQFFSPKPKLDSGPFIPDHWK